MSMIVESWIRCRGHAATPALQKALGNRAVGLSIVAALVLTASLSLVANAQSDWVMEGGGDIRGTFQECRRATYAEEVTSVVMQASAGFDQQAIYSYWASDPRRDDFPALWALASSAEGTMNPSMRDGEGDAEPLAAHGVVDAVSIGGMLAFAALEERSCQKKISEHRVQQAAIDRLRQQHAAASVHSARTQSTIGRSNERVNSLYAQMIANELRAQAMQRKSTFSDRDSDQGLGLTSDEREAIWNMHSLAEKETRLAEKETRRGWIRVH